MITSFIKFKTAILIGAVALALFLPEISYGIANPFPLEDGNRPAPAICIDVDENGILNEIDCGATGNEDCDLCLGPLPVDLGAPIDDGALPIEDEAPGPGSGPGAGTTDWAGVDLTIQDVFSIVTGIACWLIRISTAVMIIFIILAGLRFMAARGDPAQWTSAKKNFNQVLIGALVILGVYVIIATIANIVGISSFSFIPLVC